jgi:mevalonate kinase
MNQGDSASFYPSKLLLFGEHTVIQGSQALAIPLWQYGGRWQYDDDKTKQYDLPKFLDYLKKGVENEDFVLDTEGVERELLKGLYFDSNVPRGYGTGSSGVLVAAIYTVFGMKRKMRSRLESDDLVMVKNEMGKMESYFHGSSSGFDPLISYVRKPVIIRNTKIQRKAEPLISIFIEKMKMPEYKTLVVNELVPNVDDAIAAYLQNEPNLVFEAVHNISLFQHRFFPEAIPLSFKNIWLEGLAGNDYKLKLCGAGGGGFILGFTKNLSQTKDILAKSGFQIIPLSI